MKAAVDPQLMMKQVKMTLGIEVSLNLQCKEKVHSAVLADTEASSLEVHKGHG